jgi:hypothetical protein
LKDLNQVQKILSKVQLFLARLKCLLQSRELQMLHGVEVHGIASESESKTAKVSEMKKNGGTKRRYLQVLPATSWESFLLLEGNWDFPETDFEKNDEICVKYKMIQRDQRNQNLVSGEAGYG